MHFECWLWHTEKLLWTKATFIGCTKCFQKSEKMWTTKSMPDAREHQQQTKKVRVRIRFGWFFKVSEIWILKPFQNSQKIKHQMIAAADAVLSTNYHEWQVWTFEVFLYCFVLGILYDKRIRSKCKYKYYLPAFI